MNITVGIITYHRPGRVDALLDSLHEQDRHPDELIVYDESEDDRTADVVASHRDRFEEDGVDLSYTHAAGKTIQGEARNAVIDTATADILCFLDDDTVATPGWMEGIEDAYTEFPAAAAVGGPALTVDEDRNVIPDILRTPENQNTFNRYGEVHDASDRWVPPHPVETHKFRGANMSFRVDALEEIGGFDPGYRGNAYREEDDVMARLWNRGDTLIYSPDATVYHFRSPSGGARSGHKRANAYWQGRNLVRFVRKNFPEHYHRALLRLVFHTDGYPPPLWKDAAGMVVNRDFSRLWKFKGYMDEILPFKD